MRNAPTLAYFLRARTRAHLARAAALVLRRFLGLAAFPDVGAPRILSSCFCRAAMRSWTSAARQSCWADKPDSNEFMRQLSQGRNEKSTPIEWRKTAGETPGKSNPMPGGTARRGLCLALSAQRDNQETEATQEQRGHSRLGDGGQGSQAGHVGAEIVNHSRHALLISC